MVVFDGFYSLEYILSIMLKSVILAVFHTFYTGNGSKLHFVFSRPVPPLRES